MFIFFCQGCDYHPTKLTTILGVVWGLELDRQGEFILSIKYLINDF